jgi:heparosan-N-sulfate-glucuronate 5-epimerase
MRKLSACKILPQLLCSAIVSSTTLLAACSEGAIPLPLPLIAPEYAEPGEVVTARVESGEEHSFEFSHPTYIQATSPNSVTFVVPDPRPSNTLVIRALKAGRAAGGHVIRLHRPAPPTFEALPRPSPFEDGNVEKWAGQPRSEDGLPLIVYGGVQTPYHVNLSKLAQGYYASIRKGQAQAADLDQFLLIANWLRDNCEYTPYGFCSWRAYFDIPAYRLPTGWTSAMAQGQGISALISAYALTNDVSYFNVAMDAVAAFNYPISLKGVRSNYDGVGWYEEYGSEEMPAHVLNGFLFALAGLYDAYELAGSFVAHQAFIEGARSLEQRLDRFDMGFTSAYDDSPLKQIASAIGDIPDLYHELHIAQLAWLYGKTGSDSTLQVLKRFLLYDTAGLQTDPSLHAPSRKIVSITASHTIDPEQHGVELLHDSNWTWLRYWSTNRPTVTLGIELQEKQPGEQPHVMHGIRLTALTEADVPRTLQVFSCSGTERVALTGQLTVQDHVARAFPFNVNGYGSYTLVIDTPPLTLPCNSVDLEMTTNPELGLLRLRELNLHLEQPGILAELLSKYLSPVHD